MESELGREERGRGTNERFGEVFGLSSQKDLECIRKIRMVLGRFQYGLQTLIQIERPSANFCRVASVSALASGLFDR